MAYRINIKLPEKWKTSFELIEDEDGNETSHLEGVIIEGGAPKENEYIDLYVGTLPPDTTAEDEAIFNYADMIGWDESEPIGEDNSPLTVTKFQKKKAYGFEGLVEGGILRVMCVEIQPEVLLVMNVCAPDETAVAKMVRYIEVNMSIA